MPLKRPTFRFNDSDPKDKEILEVIKELMAKGFNLTGAIKKLLWWGTERYRRDDK